MNIILKQKINKIKNYLSIMLYLHVVAQMIAMETFFIFTLTIFSIFFDISINYLYIVSAVSTIIILVFNFLNYKKKTKGKYFIYKHIERNFPSLSSSLTTIADDSLKDIASLDFIKETEKLAIQEIKKVKLKDIPHIFDFKKLKNIAFTTSFIWLLLLFPLKSNTKILFLGKPAKKEVHQVKIINIFNLKAEITPPKYLKNKKNKTLENFDGSLKVYTGSDIILTGITKEEFDKCIFVYGDRELGCSIKKNKFKIKHKVLMNSLYHIRFIKTNKPKDNYVSKNFEGEIIPDNPPKIKIAFPEENLTLNFKDTLEITAEASDDIAIKTINFKYQVDDGEFEEVNIKNLGSLRETINYKLKLSDFEKGDTITYYFEAYDNDTVLGPKISTTRKLKVEIISEMKIHELFLEKLNVIVKKFTLGLADHLELNRKVSTRTLIINKESLNAKITKNNNNLKLLIKMDNPLLSVSSKETLSTIVKTLKKEITDDYSSRNSAKLIKTLENSIIYITDIMDREKIEIINQLYKSLKRSKTKLKDLINDYRKNESKETKKEILKEIRNIKRKIKRIMEKLSELSADIDSKFINKEASKVKKMAENMEKLEDLLENGDFDKLLKQLEDLEKELNEMIEGVDDKKEGLMEERDQEADKENQKFMNDLQDLIFEQKQLLKQSEKITSKLRGDIKKNLKEDNFIKKNISLLQEANNYIFNLNKDLLSNSSKENLNRIVEGLNLSLSFLKDQNLLLTLSSLKDIHSEARKMKESYKGLIEWMSRSKNHKLIVSDYKLYNKANDNRNKVINNIEKLLKKSQKSITKKDKEIMEKLSKAQENLKKKIQKLQHQTQKLPMLPPETQDNLRKGEKNMKDAKTELKNNNPNMAKFEQNSALNQLKLIKKQMQKQKQQTNKNQMKTSSKSKGKKIKIPDDNYKGPKELREDILKAMKKDAPKGHKKTVDEYFKNIIKK